MGESLAQMKGVEGIGFIGSTLVQLRKDLDECLASSAGDKSTSARHLISIRIRVFMECLHSLIIKRYDIYIYIDID